MVGNEMNEGITSFPSRCENSSIKPNGVGSNNRYLEESPTKHSTDNGLVGNLLQYQFETLLHFIFDPQYTIDLICIIFFFF